MDQPDAYAGLTDDQRLEAKRAKYMVLMHAMQSGVAQDHALGSADGTPKQLRVGLNGALSNHAALVRLLIDKGLFTEEEYFDAILAEMETEVASYERRLGEKMGGKITLG